MVSRLCQGWCHDTVQSEPSLRENAAVQRETKNQLNLALGIIFSGGVRLLVLTDVDET